MSEIPPAGEWRRATPAAAGFDEGRLAEALRFAETHETSWPRELATALSSGRFEPPPWNEPLGPLFPRGGPNGAIVRGGRLVATWGDPGRADLTFSVAKSYLAVLAGVAVAEGRIGGEHDRCAESCLDDGFTSAQNRDIAWIHLLQQTSEWEGDCWGRPDLVDRNRQLGTNADNSRKGTHRPLQKPGTFWEYNDVRVNRLSRSLMQLFRQPLPEVLRERVMEPIGASAGWTWHGYRTSWETIDGREMQGVPGGTHWGGGLQISALDQARLGLLVLRRGDWGGRQVLPAEWIARMLTPCPINPSYGYLWWLNTGGRQYPSAPHASVLAFGAGYNVIWLDFEHDLVVVARWIDERAVDGLLGRVLAALR